MVSFTVPIAPSVAGVEAFGLPSVLSQTVEGRSLFQVGAILVYLVPIFVSLPDAAYFRIARKRNRALPRSTVTSAKPAASSRRPNVSGFTGV